MKVIRIARVPAPSVSVESTVLDAVRVMEERQGGGCAVMDGDKLVGLFTERDLMLRVVSKGLDAGSTNIREVMTTNLEIVDDEAESSDALSLLVSRQIRHLPIVDQHGMMAGLLSMRNLLRHHVDELVDQLNSLEAYITADGPGG